MVRLRDRQPKLLHPEEAIRPTAQRGCVLTAITSHLGGAREREHTARKDASGGADGRLDWSVYDGSSLLQAGFMGEHTQDPGQCGCSQDS